VGSGEAGPGAINCASTTVFKPMEIAVNRPNIRQLRRSGRLSLMGSSGSVRAIPARRAGTAFHRDDVKAIPSAGM
jgi:hypothetical protein